MKKGTSKQADLGNDDMRSEYDFASMKGGVRGKYYKAYRAGHTVKIHKSDGTTTVQHFTLAEGAVLLEPDVRDYFPDSESVNAALRSLIMLIPQKRGTGVKAE
ncbi:MAG: hypothetical protein U9Q70_13440 [Chloroflexota bacterium]|nr:hypothetical protein [Chloroflexota bacterium]